MRKRHAIPLGAAIGAIALLVAAVLGLRALPPELREALLRALDPKAGLEIALQEYLEQEVGSGGHLGLEIGSVKISLLSGIDLEGIHLTRRDVSAAEQPLLDADSLSLRYDWRALAKTHRLRMVRLVSPRLNAGALGGASAPQETRRAPRLPVLPLAGVDSLFVVDASVEGATAAPLELQLHAGLDLSREGVSVELRDASARVDSTDLRLDGRAELLGDTLYVRSLRARSGGSRASAIGTVALGAATVLDLSVAVDSLLMTDVARFVPDLGADGDATGRFSVRGNPDSLSMKGHLAGAYLSYEFDLPLLWISSRPAGIAIDSVEVRSRGAELRGRLDLPRGGGEDHEGRLVFRDVDLASLAGPATGAPHTELAGSVTWIGSGVTAAGLKALIDVRLDSGSVESVPFQSVRLDGRIGDGVLEARQLELALFDGRLWGSGELSLGGEFDLIARADFPDLSEAVGLLELPASSGSAQFVGRIKRRDGELLFDGSLVGNDWSGDGYAIERIDATGTLRTENDERTIVAQGSVSGIEALGRRLGRVKAAMRYERGHLFFEEVSGTISSVDFEARGELYGGGPRRFILISSLAVTKDGERREHPDPIELWLEKNRVGLLPVHFEFRGGRVVATGEYDVDGEKELRVLWNGVDLSDVELPSPLHSGLLERTEGSVSLRESDAVAELALAFSGEELAPDTTRFAAVEVAAGLSPNGPLVARVELAGPGGRGRVVADGTLGDSLATRWAETDGDAMERLPRLIDPRIRVNADSLPVEWVRGVAKELNEVGGVLDADWTFHGDPTSISASGPFSFRPFVFKGSPIEQLSGEAALVESTLTLELRFAPDWGPTEAAIRLPARLNLLEPSFTFDKERDFALHLEVARGDLALFPIVLKEARLSQGEFSGTLDGSGPLGEADLHGVIDIRDGTTLFKDLAEIYEDVSGRIRLDGRVITLEGVEGRVSDDGRIRVDGTITLGDPASDFDLTVSLRKFYVESIAGAAATIDADLTVTTRPTLLGDPVPHITGTVTILGAVVDQEFVAEGQQTPLAFLQNLPHVGEERKAGATGTGPPAIFEPTAKPPFTCEIAIRAPRNVWISNSTIDAELLGEGTLQRSVRGLGFVGSAEVIRGTYSLVGSWIPTQLRIEEGEIFWGDPDNALNFNITAKATGRVADDEIEITVDGPFSVGGSLDSLNIGATSESGKTRDEILQDLALQSGGPGGSGSGVFDAWARTFASILTQELLQGFTPISSVEFDYEGGSTQLHVESSLFADLNLRYSQRIGKINESLGATGSGVQSRLQPERQVTLDYKLSRNLFVEALTGSLRDGGQFANLDLKARVGY